MRELENQSLNQLDYSKYADLDDLKGLKPGWLQFLQSMDCLKFAISGIVIVAIAAFQKISEPQVTMYIAIAAIAAIAGINLALGVVKNVTRRDSNGETFTNPTQNPPESGNVRVGQRKPRTSPGNHPSGQHERGYQAGARGL